MFHNILPVSISQGDSPVELTPKIEGHLVRAVEAQTQLGGPLSWLTYWPRQKELILAVGRAARWLAEHAPVSPEAIEGSDYFRHGLGGDQEQIWSSTIGLMTQRHLGRIFESRRLPSKVFALKYEVYGGYPENFDTYDATFEVAGRFVRAVILQCWHDQYKEEPYRSFAESWQIEQARLLIDALIRELAQECRVLRTPSAEYPRRYSGEIALRMWRENVNTAARALEQSRRVSAY